MKQLSKEKELKEKIYYLTPRLQSLKSSAVFKSKASSGKFQLIFQFLLFKKPSDFKAIFIPQEMERSKMMRDDNNHNYDKAPLAILSKKILYYFRAWHRNGEEKVFLL